MDFEVSVAGATECTCSGCALCKFVCPVGCIQMKDNAHGFLVPEVSDSCIGCGVCRAVCPVMHLPFTSESSVGYVARAKSPQTVESATAGGVFLPLAQAVIHAGGVAYGAVVDDDLAIRHRRCVSVEEASRCAGSKYVQSDLTHHHIFSNINEDLEAGRRVLFSGLPCQTAAVRQRFGDNTQIIVVDLVCHGVASPAAWSDYLKERNPEEIQSCTFRNKTFGYHFSTMLIRYTDRIYSKSGRLDPFLKAFFSGLMHREICNQCPFKGTGRYSDITLFDCSRFSELTGLSDDGKGYTNMLINTKKGEEFVHAAAPFLWVKTVSRARAIALNGRMVDSSTPRNPRSEQFYERLKSEGFTEVVQSLYPSRISDYIVEAVKRPFYKFGVLDKLARLKGKLKR